MEKKQHAWGWYSSNADKKKRVQTREIHVNPYETDYLKYITNKLEKWDVIDGSAIVESSEGIYDLKKSEYIMFNEDIIYTIKGGPNGITLREVKGY